MSEAERLSDGLKMVVSTGLMSHDALLATTNELTVIEAALKQADVLSGDIRPEIMSARKRAMFLKPMATTPKLGGYRVSIIGFATAFLQAARFSRAEPLNVSFC